VTPPLQHGGGVFDAKFSKDGRRLITVAITTGPEDINAYGQGPSEIVVLDLATQKPMGKIRTRQHHVPWESIDSAGALAVSLSSHVSSDGALLPKQEFAVWEIATGQQRFAREIELSQRDGAAQQAFVKFDPAGRQLVTVGAAVQVWDAETGE